MPENSVTANSQTANKPARKQDITALKSLFYKITLPDNLLFFHPATGEVALDDEGEPIQIAFGLGAVISVLGVPGVVLEIYGPGVIGVQFKNVFANDYAAEDFENSLKIQLAAETPPLHDKWR